MKCKYKFLFGECEEEAYQRSEYCILHIDFPKDKESEEFKEIAEAKKKKVEEKINKRDFNFEGAKLLEVDFSGMEIEGNLNFIDAEIGREAFFVGAKFDGDAYFGGAEIGIANFGEAKIGGNAYFIVAKIGGAANFGGAEIGGAADFFNTNFKKHANFEGASFLSSGVFDGLKKFNASFEGARLKNVAFRNCNLTNVRFKHAIFENCELSASELPDEILEHREYKNKKNEIQHQLNISEDIIRILNFFRILNTPELINDAKTVVDTYRRIRQCLQHQGAYTEAGEFYIKEMNRKKWFGYTILWISSGYGEKPELVLIWVGVIISLYIIIFGWSGTLPTLKTAIITFLLALFVYVSARKMSR